MALKAMHRLLIAAGILLAVIFGIYQAKQGDTAWVVACAVIAAALSAYLVWFIRKTRDEGRS